MPPMKVVTPYNALVHLVSLLPKEIKKGIVEFTNDTTHSLVLSLGRAQAPAPELETKAASSNFTTIVEILDGEPGSCSKFHSTVFEIILRLVLLPEWTREVERILYLLAASIWEDTQKISRTPNRQPTETNRIVAIRERCLHLLMKQFISRDNLESRRKRWAGLLILSLLSGPPIKPGLFEGFGSLFGQLGHRSLYDPDEIVRLYHGQLIRRLVSCGVPKNTLWPDGTDPNVIKDFPVAMEEGESIDCLFLAFVNNHWNPQVMGEVAEPWLASSFRLDRNHVRVKDCTILFVFDAELTILVRSQPGRFEQLLELTWSSLSDVRVQDKYVDAKDNALPEVILVMKQHATCYINSACQPLNEIRIGIERPYVKYAADQIKGMFRQISSPGAMATPSSRLMRGSSRAPSSDDELAGVDDTPSFLARARSSNPSQSFRKQNTLPESESAYGTDHLARTPTKTSYAEESQTQENTQYYEGPPPPVIPVDSDEEDLYNATPRGHKTAMKSNTSIPNVLPPEIALPDTLQSPSAYLPKAQDDDPPILAEDGGYASSFDGMENGARKTQNRSGAAMKASQSQSKAGKKPGIKVKPSLRAKNKPEDAPIDADTSLATKKTSTKAASSLPVKSAKQPTKARKMTASQSQSSAANEEPLTKKLNQGESAQNGDDMPVPEVEDDDDFVDVDDLSRPSKNIKSHPNPSGRPAKGRRGWSALDEKLEAQVFSPDKEDQRLSEKDKNVMHQGRLGRSKISSQLSAQLSLSPKVQTGSPRKPRNKNKQTSPLKNEAMNAARLSSSPDRLATPKDNPHSTADPALSQQPEVKGKPQKPRKVQVKTQRHARLSKQKKVVAAAASGSEYEDANLVDDHDSRKPALIKFDENGPRNQGVSPVKKRSAAASKSPVKPEKLKNKAAGKRHSEPARVINLEEDIPPRRERAKRASAPAKIIPLSDEDFVTRMDDDDDPMVIGDEEPAHTTRMDEDDDPMVIDDEEPGPAAQRNSSSVSRITEHGSPVTKENPEARIRKQQYAETSRRLSGLTNRALEDEEGKVAHYTEQGAQTSFEVFSSNKKPKPADPRQDREITSTYVPHRDAGEGFYREVQNDVTVRHEPLPNPFVGARVESSNTELNHRLRKESDSNTEHRHSLAPRKPVAPLTPIIPSSRANYSSPVRAARRPTKPAYTTKSSPNRRNPGQHPGQRLQNPLVEERRGDVRDQPKPKAQPKPKTMVDKSLPSQSPGSVSGNDAGSNHDLNDVPATQHRSRPLKRKLPKEDQPKEDPDKTLVASPEDQTFFSRVVATLRESKKRKTVAQASESAAKDLPDMSHGVGDMESVSSSSSRGSHPLSDAELSPASAENSVVDVASQFDPEEQTLYDEIDHVSGGISETMRGHREAIEDIANEFGSRAQTLYQELRDSKGYAPNAGFQMVKETRDELAEEYSVAKNFMENNVAETEDNSFRHNMKGLAGWHQHHQQRLDKVLRTPDSFNTFMGGEEPLSGDVNPSTAESGSA